MLSTRTVPAAFRSHVFSTVLGGKILFVVDVDGIWYYSVRQVGDAIGYTSDGGNLSRCVRGTYGRLFRSGRDYLPCGRNQMIFMRIGSLLHLLELTEQRDQNKRRVKRIRVVTRQLLDIHNNAY